MGALFFRPSHGLSRSGQMLVWLVIFVSAMFASAVGQDALPETAEGHEGLVFRGSGEKREMLLHGRFVDAKHQPINNVQLVARLRKSPGGTALTPIVHDDEFELWLPIGHKDWSFLELVSTTKDKSLRGVRGLANWRFRKAASVGIELVLQQPKRKVTVTVLYDKQPVANAHVVIDSESGGAPQKSETNARGIASLQLFEYERLNQITAWTDDRKIGGYMFDRDPPRDSLGSRFRIELDDCRDQRIRLANADNGLPIPGRNFLLTIGTGEPNFNFPAIESTMPQPVLRTDANGEATYPWFPDWEKHGSYIEMIGKRWFPVGELKSDDEGVLVQKMRPRSRRKTMYGKVVSSQLDVNGVLIVASTFQGEQEDHSDRQYAVADEDGNFFVDCIAGATYCVYASDEDFVSNTIDTIPLDLKTGKTNVATLQLTRGVDVEIRVTEGPNHEPVVSQWINVASPYSFKWEEDGEAQSGRGGRHWGVTTDEAGIARTVAPAGSALRATVHMTDWRSGDNKVQVKKNGVTKVEIYREFSEDREIKGWLTLPDESDVDLANAELTVGGVDGETDGESSSQTDKDGRFVVKINAREYGIFAYTADGKAAGSVSRLDNGPVEIVLFPTMDFQGKLVDRDNHPVANHPVSAIAYVKGRQNWGPGLNATKFPARKFESVTDANGNYTLKNLPVNLELKLFALEKGGEKHDSGGEMTHLRNMILGGGDPQERKVDQIEFDNGDF